MYSRPVRRRQDGSARADRSLLGGRHRDPGGLRRAGGGSRGDTRRIFRDAGPSRRRAADGSHRHYLQHLVQSVPAREASIYTGITLGEYYRQMGLDVLLLADSTSRWAQAICETSGRLEEIPGEEAFPAYLDSAIKSVYERAGVIRSSDGTAGKLTIIGTVSPAGGNFEEPVTQSTLGTVKTFLGLSYERAYKRFYPAVDPLASWSRYREQLAPYFDRHVQPDWSESVESMLKLLEQGDSVFQMM